MAEGLEKYRGFKVDNDRNGSVIFKYDPNDTIRNNTYSNKNKKCVVAKFDVIDKRTQTVNNIS